MSAPEKPTVAIAQGFDPAKVDWEKLSKIPMSDGFIKQFNTQCSSCHGEDLMGTGLGTPLVGVCFGHQIVAHLAPDGAVIVKKAELRQTE